MQVPALKYSHYLSLFMFIYYENEVWVDDIKFKSVVHVWFEYKQHHSRNAEAI